MILKPIEFEEIVGYFCVELRPSELGTDSRLYRILNLPVVSRKISLKEERRKMKDER